MGSVVSLCTVLIAIYIPSTISDNSQKLTKEWIFQFDLRNKNNWDNYQITQNDENTLNGASNGCTSRIPVIFKKLCVDWNDNDGFALKFKSSTNLNVDPNYDDVLWYYGDHKTARNAEKAAKEQYVDLEDKELTEIAHDNDASITLRRRLKNRKTAAQRCYWYGDARACAHIDATNKNLMTVSVGLNEEDNNNNNNNDYFGAAYNDYGDYENDEDDYNNYDMNALYAQYMQQQQALYNQQWAQYLQQLNNLYYQNMLQQQQQQQLEQQQQQNQYIANAYNQYDNLYDDLYEDDDDYDDVDSDDKEEDDEDKEGGAGGLGAGMMGISESDIMEKAEAEARKHVEAKMEKKLEGKLEKEMMAKLDHGFNEMQVHKKHNIGQYGEDMDNEHVGMPADEMEEEEMRNEVPPHDSISDSAPN